MSRERFWQTLAPFVGFKSRLHCERSAVETCSLRNSWLAGWLFGRRLFQFLFDNNNLVSSREGKGWRAGEETVLVN